MTRTREEKLVQWLQVQRPDASDLCISAFSAPAAGAWGRQGWTRIHLRPATRAAVRPTEHGVPLARAIGGPSVLRQGEGCSATGVRRGAGTVRDVRTRVHIAVAEPMLAALA